MKHLIAIYNVVCIQEAYGEYHSIEVPSAYFNEHNVLFDKCSNGNAGGLLIFIQKRWFNSHSISIYPNIVEHGRAICVALSGREGTLLIASIHIVPKESFNRKIAFMRHINANLYD